MNRRTYYQSLAALCRHNAKGLAWDATLARVDPHEKDEKERIRRESEYLTFAAKARQRAEHYERIAEDLA